MDAVVAMAERTSERPAPVLELVPPGPTDEGIVAGLRRGDPDAARALYDAYGDLINRLVWRLLGPDTEREDVVHEAFVNILSSIDGVSSPAALRSWIVGVTVNTVRREIRSRRYRRILRLVPEAAEEMRPAVETEDDRLMRAVYAILVRLPADERIAFALHHIDGQGLAEVAATLGCSLATVKRRIARTREIVLRGLEKDALLASLVDGLRHEG